MANCLVENGHWEIRVIQVLKQILNSTSQTDMNFLRVTSPDSNVPLDPNINVDKMCGLTRDGRKARALLTPGHRNSSHQVQITDAHGKYHKTFRFHLQAPKYHDAKLIRSSLHVHNNTTVHNDFPPSFSPPNFHMCHESQLLRL